MKILILSDSHGCVEAMETIVAREKPQAMVHLGDLWADGKQLGKLFPDIPLYQVAGNCDRYGWEPGQDQIRTVSLDHVVIYMTHGHLHGVKLSLLRLAWRPRRRELRSPSLATPIGASAGTRGMCY